jgi:hypothetical protein
MIRARAIYALGGVAAFPAGSAGWVRHSARNGCTGSLAAGGAS